MTSESYFKYLYILGGKSRTLGLHSLQHTNVPQGSSVLWSLDNRRLSMLGGITTLVLSMFLCLEDDAKQTVQAATLKESDTVFTSGLHQKA